MEERRRKAWTLEEWIDWWASKNPQFLLLLDRWKQLLGEEVDQLLLAEAPEAFRINTLKVANPEQLRSEFEHRGWQLERIPWYRYGFWLHEPQVDLGKTLEHFLGYIYEQDAASMVPPLVLDPQPEEVVLDMCAAPGSKATQIAELMQNQGLLLTNDPVTSRLPALRHNLQRCGVRNAIVTQMDGRRFARIPDTFDRVLVDVPCSGTGKVSTEPGILCNWRLGLTRHLARLQRQLLRAACITCKPGGVVVYSTCTLEPEENELVVDYVINRLHMRVEPVEIPGLRTRPGITEWQNRYLHPDLRDTLRIYPHENRSEGFYIAKLVKPH